MIKLLPAYLFGMLMLISPGSYAIDYDVELIIFEHARRTSTGASDNLLLPVVRRAQPIPQPGFDTGAPIAPLSELRLTAEAAKLQASDGYRILYHGGWRQPDFNQETAPFMRVELGETISLFVERDDNPEQRYRAGYVEPPYDADRGYLEVSSSKLAGGIKVWVGRFLHLDTRLAYTPQGAVSSFKIETTRRMRSRQLHYIDHSRVGIIAKIYPVDDSAAN